MKKIYSLVCVALLVYSITSACSVAEARSAAMQRGFVEWMQKVDNQLLASFADTYTYCVSRAILVHWVVPEKTPSGTVLRVHLEIGNDGQITKATLLEPSGFKEFDTSVIEAIQTTNRVIPPPMPQLREMIIGFNKS